MLVINSREGCHFSLPDNGTCPVVYNRRLF